MVIEGKYAHTKGLKFSENRKIAFLPIETFKSFPNLIVYGAQSCELKSISYDNFKKLNKVKVVILNDNEIEKLNTKIFKDLISLEWLVLRKKFIHKSKLFLT